MAEPLASKPASPRRNLPSPRYPALIALALSLPMAACVVSPAGSSEPPFANASGIADAAAPRVEDASGAPSKSLRIDGGTPLDAEPATELDAESAPMNGDPGGILAYVFTPATDPSSDDVP